MSKLVCKNCKSIAVEYEDYCGGTSYYRCKTCGQKGDKDKFTPLTLFDRITASPKVLAPQFIFKQWHAFDGQWGWFSLLLMDGDKLNSPWFESYEEAYAATVAKLKEVAE